MSSNQVKVTYSAYGPTKTVKEVELDLVKDVALKLTYNESEETVGVSMIDTISEDVNLSGTLDLVKLNELIHAMVQIRNQMY